jgi:hypothetical protein
VHDPVWTEQICSEDNHHILIGKENYQGELLRQRGRLPAAGAQEPAAAGLEIFQSPAIVAAPRGITAKRSTMPEREAGRTAKECRKRCFTRQETRWGLEMLHAFAGGLAGTVVGRKLCPAGRVIPLSSAIRFRAITAVMSSVATADLGRLGSSARVRSMTQLAHR